METKKITIRVIGDVNMNTITIPRTLQTNCTSEDALTSSQNLSYCRFQEIVGTPLLAQAIRYSTSGWRPDSPEVLTYDENILENKRGSWRELLANLSLYRNEAGASDKTVYRINADVGWIENNVQESKEAHSALLDHYMQSLPQQDDSQAGIPAAASNFTINVINDRGLGFWEAMKERDLQSLFPKTENSHFVIALGSLDEGMHKKLIPQEYCRSTVTVVLHATLLRRKGINIREDASIERTIQSFLYHLDNNPILRELCDCRHLVVRFDDGGVLHYDRDSEGPTYHYCPFFNTNEMYTPQQYGRMIGYRTIMVAAITKGIAWAIHNNKEVVTDNKEVVTGGIHAGIRLGILLGKYHFRKGFGKRDTIPPNNSDKTIAKDALKELFNEFASSNSTIPQQMATEVQSTTIKGFAKCREFAVASLRLPRTHHELENWSRVYSLRDHYEDQLKFENALQKIVQQGLDQVVFDRSDKVSSDAPWFPQPRVRCPYLEFGKIRTSDRNEIDSLIWLSAILRKYLEDKEWRKPLSIATFGPPGIGKSFTVKQILKNINPSAGEDNTLEYNVAQFTSVNNLTTAFHQAQDKALSEKVPLIIFDEFDATFNGEPLGWLKYFLAPMQDGKFNGEHGTYQVGKAIFVFAGGTSHTFEQFCDKPANPASFKSAKGPDFISRLRAYLDIGGINTSEGDSTVNDLLMYRRALILRSILEDKAAVILDRNTGEIKISNSVVRAFLKVTKYKHGVRSMEAIIEMATLARDGLVVASLPPPDQLEMHVNAEEFLGLVGSLAEQNPLERQDEIS